MANYVAVLGKMAAEKTSGAAQGFVRGAKGAFLSETPGLTSAAEFVSTMKKYADNKQTNVIAKEQRATNVINLEMVRQLRAINSNIINQTRLAASAERRAINSAAFAEEVEREKAVRDDKLLDAIKKLNGDKGTSVVKSATASFLGNLLKDILESKLPEILGGTILGKELLKRIPGRTPPPQTTPQTSPGANKPPGNVYDIKTGQPKTPSPPEVPKGGGIFKGLGAVARILGWAAIAIGAAMEVPGFMKDAKKWWENRKWGGWDEPADEMDKPIWERNKKNVTPSDSSLGLLGMNTDLPKRTSMFNNASSNRLTVRNNNPGALRNPGGKGFQKFDTPEQGMRALEHQLKLYITGKSAAAGYKILNTIEKIIPVYAPASDNNNVQRYIQNVCSWTGFKPDKVLTVNDIPVLAKAITQMEGSTEAMQYFYPDNRGSGQRYGGGPSGGGGGGPTLSPVAKSVSAIVPVSITDTGDETSRLAARYAKPVSSASGTNLQGYVSFEEREEIAKQLYDNIAATAKNTANTAKNTSTNNAIVNRANQIAVKQSLDDRRRSVYERQLLSASDRFRQTTTNLIYSTLNQSLFGKFGFGADRKRFDEPMAIGNLIGGQLNVSKKLTPFFQKLVGKQYGGQYAQIFGQVGNVFIDRFANEIGKGLGFGENSPFGFGQILANLTTKGNKEQKRAGRRMGLEQLVYSMTGIPLGATTALPFLQRQFPSIFNMAGMQSGPGGYFSTQQYLQGISNYGGRMLASPFQQGIFGAYGMMPNIGAPGSAPGNMYGYAPTGMNNLYRPVTVDGQKMTADSAAQTAAQGTMYSEAVDNQTKQQSGFFDTLGETFTNGFKSLMSVFGFSGGGGGGSLIGGGGGGGGGFFDNLMSFGGNLATMYLGNKLFQKTGLAKSKNPLVQIAGNLAMNYLVKSGFQIAANALGFGDIAGKFLGANTGLADIGGSFLGTLTGSSTAGITAANLGELGINTSLAVGSTGGPASVVTGVTGAAPIVDAGSAYLAGSTAAGSTAAGSTAALQAAQGTQAAAAFAEANAGIQGASSALGASEFLAAAAEAIPIVAAVYAVYRIINYFAFEKGDTRATYSIYVKGNNDVNAGEIVHAEKTQESHFKLVENFGKAGFVMIKKLESQGARPDFDYLTVQISFNPHRNVQMGFNTGGPGKGDRKKTPINVGPLDLRKPVDATVIKVIMDNMAKLIAERMSKSSAKSQSDLEASLKTITKSEMEGNIEGIDRSVYKDAGGRTSYNESIARRAYEIIETQGGSGEDPGYSVRTGNMAVFNAKTGQYQTVSEDSGILGYDAAGNPITSSTLSAAKNVISASPVASASSLSYQQVQTQNDELKNSNPSTATTSNGGTAVVNSGNVNNNQNTVINNIGEGSSNRKYFGTVSPEFVPAFV